MKIRAISMVLITASFMVACGGNKNASTSSSSSTSSTSSSTSSTSSSTSSSSSSSSSSTSSTSSSSTSSSSGVPVARCDEAVSAKNRQTAVTALTELFIKKNTSAIPKYWADPYLQHNPIAQSGVATFTSIMGPFVTSSSFKYEIIDAFAECDLAAVLGRYSGTGIIVDMFRLKNDKLMEHWDSDASPASVSNWTVVETDQTYAPQNRQTIENLYANWLIPGTLTAANAATVFADRAVIARVTATGPSAFVDNIKNAKITYKKVHHVIADGDLVFVIAEGALNGKAYGFYEAYRFDAGKVVYHWDGRRAVPTSTASGLGIF